MSFVLEKLIEEPDYVPYCGPCSPILRLERHASGDYNVCPRCGHESYLNGWRKWPGDRFWTYNPEHRGQYVDMPRYWIPNDGKDKTFSHAGSVLGGVLMKTENGWKRESILILPTLSLRD